MKNCLIIFIFLIITLSVKSQCNYYNRIDRKGLKQGWWYRYRDKEKKNIAMKYYYKNGREKKVCKNYYANGKKQVTFNYNKNRIRVKYFNEEGSLIQKGWAKMDYTEKEIRYFWEGKWKFYDDSRRKISESEYLDGHLISEKLFNK